jgi:ABC-type multidrug transport system ATPase subunit
VARRIGYVFQRPADNLIDYLTAFGHVRLAGQMRCSRSGLALRSDVDRLLAAVSLSSCSRRRPRELSDGQQQRLAVAMAVAGDPDLVIADEPTAELDPDGAAALADSILRLTTQGQTFVVSSHDPVLTDRADQVLVIHQGVLAAVKAGAGPLRVAVDPSGRVLLPDDALRQLPGRVAKVAVTGHVVTIQQP